MLFLLPFIAATSITAVDPAASLPSDGILAYVEFAPPAQAMLALAGTDLAVSASALAALVRGFDRIGDDPASPVAAVAGSVGDRAAAIGAACAYGGALVFWPAVGEAPAGVALIVPAAAIAAAQALIDGDASQGLALATRDDVVLIARDPAAVPVTGPDHPSLARDATLIGIRAACARGTALGLAWATPGAVPEAAAVEHGVGAIAVGLGIVDGRLHECALLTPREAGHAPWKALAGGGPLPLTAVAMATPRDCRSLLVARVDWAAAFDLGRELIGVELRTKLDESCDGLRAAAGVDVREALAAVHELTIESAVPQHGLFSESIWCLGGDQPDRIERALAAVAQRCGLEVVALADGDHVVHYVRAPLRSRGGDLAALGDNTQAGFFTWMVGAWSRDGDRVLVSFLPQTLRDRPHRLRRGVLGDDPVAVAALAGLPTDAAVATWSDRPFTAVLAGGGWHLALTVLRSLETELRTQGVDLDTGILPSPADLAAPLSDLRATVHHDADGTLRYAARGGLPLASLAVAGIAAAGVVRALAPAEEEQVDDEVIAPDEDGDMAEDGEEDDQAMEPEGTEPSEETEPVMER